MRSNPSRVVRFAAVVAPAGSSPSRSSASPSRKSTTKAPAKTKLEDQVPSTARSAFDGAGIKVSSLGLSFPRSRSCPRRQGHARQQEKARAGGPRVVRAGEQTRRDQAQIETLNQRHTLLSAQLANVTDTLTNNRLVGELDAIEGLIRTGTTQQQKQQEIVKTARGKASDLREEFVVELLGMRNSPTKSSAAGKPPPPMRPSRRPSTKPTWPPARHGRSSPPSSSSPPRSSSSRWKRR